MRRRTLLAAGLATALGLTGCAGGGDASTATERETDSPTTTTGEESGTETESRTATGTPEGGPELVDREFSVRSIESGGQRDAASVRYRTDAAEVIVDGTVWGADGCKTAVLGAATYDSAADRLSVDVATRDREDAGEVCTQAIVEIDYEARFAFSNGLPRETAVRHDARAVTTVERRSGTDGDDGS